MMIRVAIGFLMLFAVAWAQAPFTIVRPVDGSRVREVVQIRFPIRSVPAGGFIGVSINGKFVEAVAPASLDTDRERGHYVYKWDTKKLNVPDGEHTIELTLYSGAEAGSRILARTAVRVTVENTIPAPANGIALRYRWTPGRTVRYDVNFEQKETNEVQYSGIAPEETLLADAKFKGDLTIMDFAQNKALISWTVVPPAFQTLGGQLSVIQGDNMAPVYQEVDTTGRIGYQVSRLGESQQYELFYVWTGNLPAFPTRRLKPGDTWSDTIRLTNPLRSGEIETVSGEAIPATARFERLEWEQGYKCAKIVYEIEVTLNRTIELGAITLEKPKIKVKQTVYFAYDIGQVVRQTLTIQTETTQRQQMAGSGMSGFGGPPGFGGRGGFGMGEDEGELRSGGGRGGTRGPRGGGPVGFGGGPGGGAPPGVGAPGGARGGGQFGGGGTTSQATIQRLITNIDMRLSRIL
ncbi:MAG: hypothetical protein SNJ72_00440 [Fimbriimonadales bacterium]